MSSALPRADGTMPQRPYPVDPLHPALTAAYTMCGRQPALAPSSSVVGDVNCFRVRLPQGPVEYFKYAIVAVGAFSRDRAYAPRDAAGSEGPKRFPKWLMRAIADTVIKDYLRGDHILYDGMASLYTPVKLDLDAWSEPQRIVVRPQGGARRGGDFDVTVKWVLAIGVADLERYVTHPDAPVDVRPALQVLDLVLRDARRREITDGSVAYSPRNPTRVPGDPTREIYSGVRQSVRMGDDGPVLVLDPVQSAFYVPCTLIELACQAAGVRNNNPWELPACRDRWERALRRVDVYATHVQSTSPQTICEVGAGDALETTFESTPRGEPKRTVTVAQYMKERYGTTLRYAQLPVVNVGSRQRPSWLPMELCKLCPGQRCADNTAVSNMPKLRPAQRRQQIQEWFNSANYDTNAMCRAFGLRVEPTMVQVQARSLEPPELRADSQHLMPRDGQWNYVRARVIVGARLNSWGVVNFSSLSDNDIKDFTRAFVRRANRLGLNVAMPTVPVHRGGSNVERTLRDAVDSIDRHADLLLVVLESTSSPRYAEVKRVAHSELGVVTQCVAGNRNKMMGSAYIDNVVLQINIKLGSVNGELRRPPPAMQSGATIIFGVSVDDPKTATSPVAAIVACIHKFGAKFIGRERVVRLAELPSALAPMIYELFVAFEARHKQRCAPNKIIYFRDAASDGEMESLFQSEMRAIHHAWLMFATDAPTPPITFVVVTRSHHVRMFPLSNGDRSGNAPAGTAIDSAIVDPRRFSFFLFGHNGLIGTSRPALYTVLRNELGLGVVEMEQLCFALCHVVGRSTRSVAVVAPVVYAQDLEARAHCLFAYSNPDAASTTRTSDTHSGDSSSSDDDGVDGVKVCVHRRLRNQPFFA